MKRSLVKNFLLDNKLSAAKLQPLTNDKKKHVATDFDWEGLEGLDLHATGLPGQLDDNVSETLYFVCDTSVNVFTFGGTKL